MEQSMEQIKNLIATSRNNICILEEYVFENNKQNYFNLKIVTDNMKSQIDSIEELVPVAIEDNEYIQESINQLNFFITSCQNLQELYKTKNVTLILEENGNFKANVTEKTESLTIETNVIENDTDALLNSLDEDKVETVYPTEEINASAIIETISGMEESITNTQTSEPEFLSNVSFTPMEQIEESEEKQEYDSELTASLDIDAINAFLSNNQQPDGITL